MQLVAFQKFDNTAEALGAVTALVESKLSKSLRKFLKKEVHGETLAIADSKLGRIISDKLVRLCPMFNRRRFEPLVVDLRIVIFTI